LLLGFKKEKMKEKIRLYELAYACYVYVGFTNFDETYRDFLTKTAPGFDMRNENHREALLGWLNKWGCRQFEKSFHKQASQNLRLWHEKNEHLLPLPGKTLLDLSEDELNNAKVIYKNLMNEKASLVKGVGPTGASKILFALRKDVFPPWDRAMRKGSARNDGSPESYKKFLLDTKNQLLQLEVECKEYGIILSELPRILERPEASLVYLVDEYDWVVITRRCLPPPVDKLEKWYHWAKGTQ
jgi:hypothetical protein